jgi:phosphate transport system ATP-binding protein
VDPLMPPPPIRKISLEAPPTVVHVPPAGAGGNGNGNGNGGVAANGHHPTGPPPSEAPVLDRMACEAVTISYGAKVAVNAVDLPIRQGEVLAMIGPSGCGKTTLLRSLNRLTELTPGAARGGRISLDGQDVDALEVTELRKRVSMVFQQPNPFPMSVFDNVAYGLREGGSKRPRKKELMEPVERALERAGLWHEVKDNLDHPALRLSGGQQQRLCIARSLAAGPEVMLMDEPCSALDPISTGKIEELILELREQIAVVIVTHNLQQAQRVADRVAFMYLGELVEYGTGTQVFDAPQAQRTRDYVGGAFG